MTRLLGVYAACFALFGAAAQAQDEPCAVFYGDVQFCHNAIGLDFATQNDLGSGGFVSSDDPNGSGVYIYVTPTASLVEDGANTLLAEMDASFLDTATGGQERDILSSEAVDDPSLVMFQSVRYEFSVDYGRVFALTLIVRDGLTITVLTREGGVGRTFTDDHRTRHAAAVSAMRFPKADPGCYAMEVGFQLCPGGTQWAGLAPFYIPNGLALVDLNDVKRNVLIAQTSIADAQPEFSDAFIDETNRDMLTGTFASLFFVDSPNASVNGRDWQVVDFSAQTSEQIPLAGRSSSAISGGIFTYIRTTRNGLDARALPEDFVDAHATVRAALTPRAEGDAGWLRVKGQD